MPSDARLLSALDGPRLTGYSPRARPASSFRRHNPVVGTRDGLHVSGAELARTTWRRLILWGAPANAGGVLVVALFLVLLLPTGIDAQLNIIALVV